jgi:glucose/arabinose dehydrogenase
VGSTIGEVAVVLIPFICGRRRGGAARAAHSAERLEPRLFLAGDLVAAYAFNEGAGTFLGDASGLDNNGTVNGATWAAGKNGGALSFNGTSNWVTVADANSLDLTNGTTLEAWVKPAALGSWRTALLKEATGTMSYALYASDNVSRPQGFVHIGTADRGVQGPASLALNTWSHLATTYDGAVLRLYVNGVEAATRALTGGIVASAGPLRLGGNSVWGEYFSGSQDDVRVYSRALSAAEVQADMNTPVGSVTPPADTTPPSVASASPANGSSGVSTSANVVATFSEPMNAATINTGTVELRDPAGAPVSGTVSYSAASNSVTFDPAPTLAATPTYYTARVRGGAAGVKDAAGNPLPADYTWSFTTGQPNFQQSAVIGGLTEPTVVRFAPDGRVFVAEKSGLIKVFDNLADTTPTVFADLRTQVHNFWDRGLLGMALHPNFPATPYVYVLYTYDGDVGMNNAPKYGTPGGTSDPGPDATGQGAWVSGRVSRLTASGDTMVPGSELVLVHDWAQQFPSHSIGSLQFGPDGALYASGGDGASFNYADYGQTGNPFGDPPGAAGTNLTAPTAEGGALRAQDLRSRTDSTTLDGSIIRIDPNTGAALPTNPLYSTGNDANAKRIIAEGLRNPFRFTIRPGTNELWIGDVGWNTWEEIDRIKVPTAATYTNFGWPAYEGMGRQGGYDALNLNLLENLYADPSAHTAPYYTYNHADPVVPGSGEPTGGSSVTGVAFYGSGSYPTAFNGALFFADYSRNRVYVMFQGPNGDPDPNTRAVVAGTSQSPVHLEIGPGGDLFYASLTGGSIRRITYSGANRAPTAVATASPPSGPSPLTVTFDATGSTDPDPGDTLSYAWDLDNDGQFDDSTAARPTFTYTTAGSNTVRLRVTDRAGASDTTSLVVSVNNSAPAAAIDTPAATLRWKVGDVVSFTGHASDAEDGALGAARLSWSLVLLHGTAGTPGYHEHFIQDFAGVASGSFVTPDHEYPSKLQLRLTATDSGGLSSTTSVDLDPLTVGLTFQTSPGGLALGFNGNIVVTPFTQTVIAGSSNSITAPSPQSLGGTNYNFAAWSDGGAATHNIVAGSASATYTATYAAAPPPSGNGLVAAYGFEEGAGPTAGDASGTGNTGTLSGATWTTAGKFGRALSFNGTSNWVTVADADSLDLSTGMTLEAWVRPVALSGWTTVVMKERTGGLAYTLYASDNTGRPPAGYIRRSSDVRAVGTSAIPLNAWTHLASTYDGANLRVYVNGALAGTTAVTGAVGATTSPLRIGGNAVWGEYFNGLIDEVRVYNRALSAAEVQSDMNTAVAPGFAAAAAPLSAAVMSADTSGATGSILTGTVAAGADGQRNKHNRRNHRRDRLRLGDAGAVRAVKHRRGPAYAFVAGSRAG